MLLTESERKSLITFARKTLEAAFTETPRSPQKEMAVDSNLARATLLEPLPCFVTLVTKSGQLRGCIGCLETKTSLISNIFDYTRHAAFDDPRFNAVKKEEVRNLNIEISVLGPSVPLPSLDQVVIGKHGLNVRHGYQSGVLLAKVAVDWKWSPTEFLEQTCLKAGLDPKNADTYDIFFFEELSFKETDFASIG